MIELMFGGRATITQFFIVRHQFGTVSKFTENIMVINQITIMNVEHKIS